MSQAITARGLLRDYRPGPGSASGRRGSSAGLLFDVEGQGGLARYLRELYGKRLSVSSRKGGAPRQLRLRA